MGYLWWSVLGLVIIAGGIYGVRACWEADRDILGPLCVVIALAGFFVFIMGIAWRVSDVGCRHQGETMHVPSDYSLWTSCVVKIGDRWIPLDNYRGTEEQ